MIATKHTFCRICAGKCGLLVDVDQSTNKITRIQGDKAHPMTQGYICIKGVEAGNMHQASSRLLMPLEKQKDGSFKEISAELALDRIAERLQNIIDKDGANSVATFRGTQHYANTTAFAMLSSFINAIGTQSRFSTMTIDQSAKWVTDHRLGVWGAGRQRFENADVWMFVGYNPIVSVQGINGFPALNPVKRLKYAKARGMKIVVIDPRKTETARYADVHLQLLPGEDPTVMAGLIRQILESGWHDQEFCRDYVDNLTDLQRAVDPFTPEYVAQRAGIDADKLLEAAEIFAHQATRGVATSGTGPDMAPRSNLAEHLIEVLNVICGRFIREGEALANPGAMSRDREVRAEVIAPKRGWEQGEKSRVRNLGMINGEKMSGVLAEEILTPGDGQIKALIIDGGNPVNALADRQQVIEAMSALDLLVTVDPYFSETAQLADYIIPPTMMFERADLPMLMEKTSFPEPFAQYSEPVLRPPAEANVVEDWYVFWSLAKRMGLPMRFVGINLDMQETPRTEYLLELLLRDAQIPVEEIKKHPSGKVFKLPTTFVSSARADRQHNRFQVAPNDVIDELSDVANESTYNYAANDSENFPLRLSVRRTRNVMNTSYRQLDYVRKRMPTNPLWVHPLDLENLGLKTGDKALLSSAIGEISVQIEADESMRQGVVSICHGWGGNVGSNERQIGVSINALISAKVHNESINAMPWYSAVPVKLA